MSIKFVFRVFLFLPLFFFPFLTLAETSITITPESVIQGEPFMVQIEGVNFSMIEKVSFDGKRLDIFVYQAKPTALVGLDLNKKTGEYSILLTLASGETLTKDVVVGKREKIEAPLGIPEKLGGNTPTAQKAVVTALSYENVLLSSLRTGKKAFWTEEFRFPLESPIITDPYGYSRKTGAYSIAHKGTDFRAPEGTNVVAMNRGVVRMARQGTIYGKTIVVDHGLGLMTFYMHLSKIKVNVGELVLRGQSIGLSGKTGYAESPHLHLTVRLGGISIDPMKFVALFQ